MSYLKIVLFCCFVFTFHQATSAQVKFPVGFDSTTLVKDSIASLRVGDISISGNKKTKTYIIQREIHFKSGDTLKAYSLAQNLEQARRQVYNLNLFSEVTVMPVRISDTAFSMEVHVTEKWFVYPVPQFQMVDRNFNEWIKTFNADFNRVIYGAKFIHYNFSGRGDQLHIFLLNGYARNISFSYSTPYSNSALTEGFRISAGFTQNREISYKTSKDNKLMQFRRDGFVRDNFNIGISYQSRRGYFRRHQYAVGYTYMNVNDSILTPAFNPNYLNSNRSYKGIIDFAYNYQYSNTDNINYPLTGKIYRFAVFKRGLGLTGGVNMFSIEGYYNKFIPHFNNRLFSSIQLFGNIKLPFYQPYINQRGLGYGDAYLRGLEYYVIDGVASFVGRYTLKKKLFAFNIPVPFKIKALPKIPFTFFGKTYADAGYSYNKPQFEAKLNNRFLYSGGFGIDILSLYDVNISFEYSFNQLGENGLFLHTRGGF